MNTSMLALLIVQLITVLVGPILLAVWIRHRYGAAWSSLGWGALTFPLSQAARLPLLLGTAALLNPLAQEWDAEVLFWSNFVILTLTSGLFEEGARYIVLRWWGKSVRNWREGLMYGAGHGGIEAILIVGGTAISNIVLLATADSVLAQLGQMAPEQAAAVSAQIDALRARYLAAHRAQHLGAGCRHRPAHGSFPARAAGCDARQFQANLGGNAYPRCLQRHSPAGCALHKSCRHRSYLDRCGDVAPLSHLVVAAPVEESERPRVIRPYTNGARWRGIDLTTYLIETPYPLEKATVAMAGEQSSGTFVVVPGETDEYKG